MTFKDYSEIREAGLTPGLKPEPRPDADDTEMLELHGKVTKSSEYTETDVEWLWQDRIPKNMFTLLEGDPATGKSTIVAELVACLTTGRALPCDTRPRDPMIVAMLSDEAPWKSVVVPQLAAAGADLDRVYHFEGIPELAGKGYLRPYSLHELDLLRDDLRFVGAGMMVLDPIMSHIGDNRIDSNKDQHTRSVLGPLSQMAEEDGVTVLALRHFTKEDGRKAIYRGGGSIGFTATARVLLQTGLHPEDGELDQGEQRRVLSVAKSNLGLHAASLTYRTVQAPGRKVAMLEWCGECKFTAQQLQDGPDDAEKRSVQKDAEEWLALFLKDGSSHSWKVIVDSGKEECHSERTLRRVRGNVAVQQGGNNGAQWVRKHYVPKS